MAADDWAFLARRYGADFAPSTADPNVATVTLRPQDPELPVRVFSLDLKITVPATYPTQPAMVAVATEHLPPPIVRALNALVARQALNPATRGSPNIRATVRHVENHLATMLRQIIDLQAEAAARAKQAAAADAAGDAEAAGAAADAAGGAAAAASTAAVTAAPTVDVGPTAGAPASPVLAREDSYVPPPASGPFTCQWSYEEQARLERAIREVLVGTKTQAPLAASMPVPLGSARSPATAPAAAAASSPVSMFLNPLAWQAIAGRVASDKTAEDCLARYLLLRRICSDWHAALMAPPAPDDDDRDHHGDDVASVGGGESVGGALDVAASGAAVAADGDDDEDEEDDEDDGSDAFYYSDDDDHDAHLHDHDGDGGSTVSSLGDEAEGAAALSGAVPRGRRDKYWERWLAMKATHAATRAANRRAAAAAAAAAAGGGGGGVAADAADGGDGDGDRDGADHHDDDLEAVTRPGEGPLRHRRRFAYVHRPEWEALAPEYGPVEDAGDASDSGGGGHHGRRSRSGAAAAAAAAAGVAASGGAAAGAAASSPADADDSDAAAGGGASADVLPFTGVHLAPPHRGSRLMLDGLGLFGVGTLACNRITLQLQCDRCSNVVDAPVAGVVRRGAGDAAAATAAAAASTAAAAPAAAAGAASSGGATALVSTALVDDGSGHNKACEHKSWCGKCSLLLGAYYRPTLVHEGWPSLGYVDTSQCSVIGVADAAMFATCIECSSLMEVPRFHPPQTWEATCRECFSRLRVDARGEHIEIATRDNVAPKAYDHAAAAAGKGGQRFQVGRPLPAQGTCKHFKHSYRWLRFPCCGLAFACPACHDDASDHHYEFARRMICGHCAREQPFANAPCVACSRSLGRNSGPIPRFWEGGKGQRDRRFMSRRDPRKFKDPAAKTKSRRSTRTPAGQPVKKKA